MHLCEAFILIEILQFQYIVLVAMQLIPTTIKNKELVERRREQLVLAAITLFARKGYHKTTLKDLAAASGISYGNIYDYVGCKEDILFLIHSFVNKSAHEILSQSLNGVNHPLEKLRSSIKAELNILHEWSDAVLLLYRETHILMNKRDYLNQILQRERERLKRLEVVLRECMDKGYLPEVNIRLTANLIKIMCEACVLKGWDLKGHTTQSEMENHIVNLVFQGLVQQDGSAPKEVQDEQTVEGKSVLFINGDTLLAKAILPFLLSKGLKLAVYGKGTALDPARTSPPPHAPGEVRFYCEADVGPLSEACFRNILKDFGPIDMVVQDLGTGMSIPSKDGYSGGKALESNFRSAQDLAPHLEVEITKRGQGRVLYLAPWAWDRDVDDLRYQTVKAGAASLTKTMAQRLSVSKVTVNCLIPGFIGGVRPLGVKGVEGGDEDEGKRRGIEIEISELLKLIGFLISEDSKCLTGQVLEVGAA